MEVRALAVERREPLVRRQPARVPVPEVACFLQDVLGQRLAAEAVGVRDPKAVGAWARGARLPHPQTAIHLRHAYEVVQLLLEQEGAETVRAWFAGMNPELDDRSPASQMAAQPAAVVGAARAFLAG